MWALECWQSEYDALTDEAARLEAQRDRILAQRQRAEQGITACRAKLAELGVK